MSRGRPKGSKNRSTVELRGLLDRMEGAGEVDMAAVVRGLYGLATDEKQPAGVRIAASREILNRRYGLPKALVETTHELGRSAADLLVEIARSDRHRAGLEALEREREQRRLAATTVEVVAEERNA
jgi:hypothetical protein